MPTQFPPPTAHIEVNIILQELLGQVQNILGSELIGMYLDGSLSYGGFDEDSDIDFVVVTRNEVNEEMFLTLQRMHDQIAQGDSRLADQLEGTYISAGALRRYDPNCSVHPNIERGQGERLKLAKQTETWDVHRYFLREHGITLLGPAPHTLVDPVSPGMLRRAMKPMLAEWLPAVVADPAMLGSRGYQSYAVLSICRILYTLKTGSVVSKQAASAWAKETQGAQWHELIDDAWVGRHYPGQSPRAETLAATARFAEYALRQALLET